MHVHQVVHKRTDNSRHNSLDNMPGHNTRGVQKWSYLFIKLVRDNGCIMTWSEVGLVFQDGEGWLDLHTE